MKIFVHQGALGPSWERPIVIREVVRGGVYKLEDLNGKELVHL